MKTKCWRKTIYYLFCIGVLAIASFVAGCSSDSGSTPVTEERGDLAISLTDAPGDFIHYTVDVLSISLTKANGAQVETLPLTTQVDFAQYTDMTEFLTAATVPAGAYTQATLTLDYQNADIWVEDETGQGVQVAADNIRDDDGNPVTTMTVSVYLDGRSKLVIAPGIPAHLTLDFDLNASNVVTFSNDGTPTLTVAPTLVADVNFEGDKIHRVRGPLKSVDADASRFEIIVRPFYQSCKETDAPFGTLTVRVNDDTVYDINGDMYTGSEGLSALAQVDAFTGVVALGELKFQPLRFEAREVRAGSSVAGGTMDAVTGNVVRRTDNEIEVIGASILREEGTVIFNDRVIIQLGDDTRVTRQFSASEYDLQDISVGQRVTVFGDLDMTDPDQLAMDATAGYVYMRQTTLRGTVNSVEPGALRIQLKSIDNRWIDEFDFTGTGMDEPLDADPADYSVDTAQMDLSALADAYPIKIRGFVNAFGQAEPDFYAATIVKPRQMRSFVKINWQPPTDSAIQEVSDSGMTLNLAQARLFYHMGREGMIINLKNLGITPMIQPDADGSGLFIIKQRGMIQVFTQFEDFALNLEDRLADQQMVKQLFATGSYDDAATTLTTHHIVLKML